MPEFKQAFAGDETYVGRFDGKPQAKLWVVTTQHPNSTQHGIKRVAAYFTEKLARAHAASLVGNGELIGLETIEILEAPPKE